jgi:hypothetical protein
MLIIFTYQLIETIRILWFCHRSKDAPSTGSPAVRYLNGFEVHHYIVFFHLKDYQKINECGAGAQVVKQGEPPLTSGDTSTINWNR